MVYLNTILENIAPESCFFCAMSTRAEVEALLCLIRDASLDALNAYENHGATAPRLQSTDVHPLDQSRDRIEFMKTIAILEGACEQLCSTLAPPTQTVLNVSHMMYFGYIRAIGIDDPDCPSHSAPKIINGFVCAQPLSTELPTSWRCTMADYTLTNSQRPSNYIPPSWPKF